MASRDLLLISSSYAGDGNYLDHCWQALAELYGIANGPVLFIPYAHAYDWNDFAGTCVAQFTRHGIPAKSILEYPDPRAAVDDAAIAGLFIAGGNTFKLLKYLYDYRLIAPIRQRVRRGLPYAGVSAGAVAACPGIYTTNDMPVTKPDDLTALGLVPFQINPHFVPGELIPQHHGETREQRIEQFLAERRTPVIGLPEGGWLKIHNNTIALCGTKTAALFTADKPPKPVSPGRVHGLAA